MSLNNTTDILSIINGEEINSVNYNKELGANGDGNSLQLISGSWVASSPTPGKTNSASNQTVTTTTETLTVPSNSSTTIQEEKELMKQNIIVSAGGNKNVVVGAETLFSGTALGLERTPLKNAQYLWNFGDGDTGEGQNVLHNYQYPGEYMIVMNVSSGVYMASDRVVVKAFPAEIIISLVDDENGFVELHNKSGYELDLSWWKIKSGDNSFAFPKDTIILANKKLTLPSKITGLYYLNLNQTYLLYPNGEIVHQYNPINSYNSDYVAPVVVKPAVNYVQVENNLPVNESLENENQMASVNFALGEKTDTDLFNKWTFSLGGLILTSIVGVMFTKRINGEVVGTDESLKPEDFKIIE